MHIILAMSILGGKCVRLTRSSYEKQTIYEESPLDLAMRFEQHGIKKLHLVDLDGARERKVVNYNTLELISKYTKLEIDFGGGIETDGDATKCFEYGASQINVGTLAVDNKDLFSGWLMSFGRNKVILSADVNGDKIAIKGRQKMTELNLKDYADYYYYRTLQYLKCVDINRDGVLEGPNFDLYTRLVRWFPDLKILTGGGISSMEDVRKLQEIGVYGVIIGKAFYEGIVNLKQIEEYLLKNA